jgi:ribulose-phosphate 3-epimerase
MVEIIPAVLAHNADDCQAKLLHPGLRSVANIFQIDVLDGSMFDATCFADPKIIAKWPNLPTIELHLMVHNPLPIIELWHSLIPTLKRVIIHAELARPLGAILERASALGLEIGLTLNPETSLDRLAHHLHDLDVIQIMGVHPGSSNQPFLGEQILAKIRRCRQLHQNLIISVDGGVNLKTTKSLINAGANRLIAGSVLWSAINPAEVYTQLKAL